MIGALMLDVAGHSLTPAERDLLAHPQVGGVILFGRNVNTVRQVADLTSEIRAARPDMLIAVDQEGGRVQRLRNEGFTRLPPMRQLGHLYDQNPAQALLLAREAGFLMASEVLAVGIDFSFAPVLDLDGVSLVIGDRGFHSHKTATIELARAFMAGMSDAGMATTGKHFPGHGSIEADSHVAQPVDSRELDAIVADDMQVFVEVMDQLDAIMPAHVIFDRVDSRPAGFSPYWLQTMLRGDLGFDGVIFSDDLSMQAAGVAGDAGDRIRAALAAGCDMGLVCNDPAAALLALRAVENAPLPNQARLERMRAQLTPLQGDRLELGERWASAVRQVSALPSQIG